MLKMEFSYLCFLSFLNWREKGADISYSVNNLKKIFDYNRVDYKVAKGQRGNIRPQC